MCPRLPPHPEGEPLPGRERGIAQSKLPTAQPDGGCLAVGWGVPSTGPTSARGHTLG